MAQMTRIDNEIQHGQYIAAHGEDIWNWSSPAGKIRWQRRCELFQGFLGNNDKQVLEIGCGTGLFTAEIAQTKNRITAIDISPELIELAKKRPYQYNNVSFKVDNAYQTGFPDNSFDFIVGSSVLHHLELDQALKEFYRILRPGGACMFTEPNMLNPQIFLQKNIPFLKKMLGDSPDETAFVRWSLAKKLKAQGFTASSIIPFDFLHPVIPGILLPVAAPLAGLLEHLPLLREFAGSLIVTARKPA